MCGVPAPHRTAVTLADGRELIYFDDLPGSDRTAADTRDLPPPPPASELRYDPLLDEWVAVAAHRQTRTYKPPTTECPLCPSTPDFASEIPAADYDVAVFENRFPSFSARVAGVGGTSITPVTPTRAGAGRCEVVCFTSDHNGSFAGLTPARVRTVVDAWADRTEALTALPEVEQVFCFENRGEEIGVTLHHPHGQIYAYPYIPQRTRQHLASVARHPDLFADVVAAESGGPRVVAANDHWTAFVPAFARWPYEIHVYPLAPVPDIPSLSDDFRDAFGPVYLEVLRRLDGLFGVSMPYIAAWYQAPARTGRDAYRLHLQVTSNRRAPGKLKFMAGSEAAMGAWVNDVPPEQAAAQLREVAL
ncbi:galactose-1-phosphate uridylyltransferase [Virgisporangium aurantiacum]